MGLVSKHKLKIHTSSKGSYIIIHGTREYLDTFIKVDNVAYKHITNGSYYKITNIIYGIDDKAIVELRTT